jgi:Tol biopolymer transport system component
MNVEVGTRLAHYELTALIGEGGMGRVFQARDTKLGRQVAVKVLPEAVADDADRVARFAREASLLAALNHPRIAAIHGMEEASGHHFLVMELIGGETIADRLQRGPIPVVEAVALGTQIADALEAAHAQGIIHRDLKPANIKITPDGQIKVLDFGLAKAMEPTALSGSQPALTASPTLSLMATQAGMILGTAAYMSPEQAKGLATDPRTDVFSFGVVLFEMLSGRQPFTGETVPDILASVLAREPELAQLPPTVSSRLRAIIRRCLEKNPRRRWQAIGDVRLELESLADSQADEPVDGPPVTATNRTRWLLGAAAVTLVVSALAAATAWRLKPEPMPVVTRFSIEEPTGNRFEVGGRTGQNPLVSPDGRTLAFTARDAKGQAHIWVRRLDAAEAQQLPDTRGVRTYFWSPDSRFLAFFADNKLKRIATDGGPTQTLCDAEGGLGGAWSAADVIVAGVPGGGLVRVPASGGPTTPVTVLGPGQTSHRFPAFLGNGSRFLYYATGERAVYVASLDGGSPTLVLKDVDTTAISSSSGHLVFGREGILLAQSFDPQSARVLGDPVPIAENVAQSFVNGFLAASVSETGTLVFGSSPFRVGSSQQLMWLDRQGRVISEVGTPGLFKGIDLAVDGNRLAFHRDEGQGGDIWIMDLSRGTSERLTLDGPAAHTGSPQWSPDGKEILFSRHRAGRWSLWRKTADGVGTEAKLMESDELITPMAWSPDGRFVYQKGSSTQSDLWVLPTAGPPHVLQQAPGTDSHGQVSPDGRWIAYGSSETRRPEVYIRSFPDGARKWLVSSGGGSLPRWRGDGRELFYLSGMRGEGEVVSVEIEVSGTNLKLSAPRPLFESGYAQSGPDFGGNYHTYVVSRDGQRFLIPRVPGATSEMPERIEVIVNWAATMSR